MNPLRMITAGLFAALLAAAGCGGDGGIGGTGTEPGTLRFAITDAPACGYDQVNITIEKIRVHRSGSAGEADAGWSELVLTPARRIDLLSLQNGVLAELGETSLPAGTYRQMRLVLAANGNTAPFANSVIPTGGAEVALTTPSAQQSGLKLNVNIDVPAGQVADIVLDFDACKSVVRRGNSGQYNLKPVIAVIPRVADAGLRIIGFIDPSIAAAASVSAQASGAPVKATAPDANGQFVLYPVPAGIYDLVVTAPGRVTSVMTGVPVVTTAPTQVNSALVPIAPAAAASAPRAVTGTVTPVSGTVRALQTFTGGPTIEAQWASVDALSGAFEFALVADAPRKVAYAPSPLALNFVSDPAAAGRYTIEAQSGTALQTRAIDVTLAAPPPITFVFP
jgi:hypothetical protein